MIFRAASLPGAFVIEPEPRPDERGFFARTWCRQEFDSHGLDSDLVQCSLSYNRRAGTLRGMHFQASPCTETKVVSCTRGAICDVIIDLRPESPAFKRHFAVTLTAENRLMLYIPRGVAHGFLTLDEHAEVYYQISTVFSPEHARGVRWNDRAFNISWPRDVAVISERDRSYPDFVA